MSTSQAMTGPTPLDVTSAGASIPTVYWAPTPAPWGVVLSCHGGSGHKMSAGNQAIAAACASRGLAVIAIDGPAAFAPEDAAHHLAVGVSMGTGYGIPFLGRERRVVAAAIGLWGMSYPASEHLWDHARRIECPVWFTQQWDDPKFERSSTFELLDTIGATDKRLVAYPGGHVELEGERLEDAVDFLEKRLRAARA